MKTEKTVSNLWVITYRPKRSKLENDIKKMFCNGSYEYMCEKIAELSAKGDYVFNVHCNSYALEK